MEYTSNQYYEMYRDFRGMLLAKANQINMPMDSIEIIGKIANLDRIHAILFADYINQHWHAYCWDIIMGEYHYIHMTGIVWDSFKEYMAK